VFRCWIDVDYLGHGVTRKTNSKARCCGARFYPARVVTKSP
jgi:hypothetical protein